MSEKRSILYFIVLWTQVLSLLESGTRSAWVGFTIGFLLVGLWLFWKKKKIPKKLVLIIVVIFLFLVFSNLTSHQKDLSRSVSITHDVQKIIKNDDAGSAGSSRWFIWQVSMPIIANHFWLGTGPNTFQEVFHPSEQSQVKKYLGDVNKIYDENNDYLQIALTMGVPALLIYLIFLFIILFKGFRQVKVMDERQQMVSNGLQAAIVGYMVQAFFNISVVSVAPYFWLLLGFFVNKNRLSRSDKVLDSV